MGYRKKVRENKRAKSSSVQERERESEKKKSSHAPSQKEVREGKLVKGVPLPPKQYRTHAHLDQFV